ncbi:MAG: hypothetical protein H6822_16320 [Planctomycetaceae bacterium]|nr:hypothetical protein [Planctomycetales bacterium]MCB9923747.1 hypothetical protein [Planctomycetaceae bacterium]
MPLFAMILATSGALCVLIALARWAESGTGYWPPGGLGLLLAMILGLGSVCAVPALINAIGELTPWLWVFPPF